MFLSFFLVCSHSPKKSENTVETEIDTEEDKQEQLEPPVNGVNNFEYDELIRGFRIHIPEEISPGAPLVIVMHGYSSSAEIIESYSGMNALADEEGFVVVYPQGTEDNWGYHFFNVGYEFHSGNEVDDIGYINALIEYLQGSLQLSTANVFSMGMSNGGDMSYLLACQNDKIRAIAPIAGTMLNSVYEACAPSKSIPVLEVHGTEDAVTLWAGDMQNQEGWGAYLPIDDIIQFWSEHNRLDLVEVTDIEDVDTSDGSKVVFHRYYAEGVDTEVQLYEVVGGGHDWPGAFGNADINSSRLAWEFFSSYLD